MSCPSLDTRADTVSPETHVTSEAISASDSARRPVALVISAHADERGAREAARWAEQVGADAAVSSDSRLEARVDAARRVLVLDPGVIASRRGFGPRASARERLALVARLAGHPDRVTWAATGAQATQWVQKAAQ